MDAEEAHRLLRTCKAVSETMRVVRKRLDEAALIFLPKDADGEGHIRPIVHAVRVGHKKPGHLLSRHSVTQKIHHEDLSRHQNHTACEIQLHALTRRALVCDPDWWSAVCNCEPMLQASLLGCRQIQHQHELRWRVMLCNELQQN